MISKDVELCKQIADVDKLKNNSSSVQLDNIKQVFESELILCECLKDLTVLICKTQFSFNSIFVSII